MKSILASLLVVALTCSVAGASCIRQSLMNHDYCGPEGSRLAGLVPEGIIGSFVGACASHDACYGFGGEDIVRAMEQQFQKSMISATKEEKKLFSSEMKRLKSSCDKKFLADLQGSCSGLSKSDRKVCLAGAKTYFRAVDKVGSRIFWSSVDAAFTCRS